LLPVLVVAAAAFAGGMVVAAGRGSDEREVVERFARAWERGDYGAMHAELTDASGERVPLASFARRYRQAATLLADPAQRTAAEAAAAAADETAKHIQ